MARRIVDHPSTREMWAALQEQREEIGRLRALVDRPDQYEAGSKQTTSTGEVVSRAGLLKAAAMGAAGVAGAGTLLQNGAGIAGASGSEGQTTFNSATTTPTVTINNTSSGLAIKANAAIQTAKGVTAMNVTATNPSTASGVNAVRGQMSSTSAGVNSAGVRGQNLSTSGAGIGVYGSQNGAGIGVYGTVAGGGYGGAFVASSGIGAYTSGDWGIEAQGSAYGGVFYGSEGVYGSGTYGGVFYGSGSGAEGVFAAGSSGADGVYATSDTGYGAYVTTGGYDGLYATSSDTSGNGVVGEADGSGAPYGVWGFTTNSSGYGVFSSGNFAATGTKSAIVPAADGSHRALYCVESPECWFEDFGSAQLVNGHASVTIDPMFAGVVHTDLYHIYLTAEGNSKGLYVASKSATGFEVREQDGGRSNVTFSYRVVAKRKDVVAPRLEQVTLKQHPARQSAPAIAKPSPRKPTLDPHPEANAVEDPTA